MFERVNSFENQHLHLLESRDLFLVYEGRMLQHNNLLWWSPVQQPVMLLKFVIAERLQFYYPCWQTSQSVIDFSDLNSNCHILQQGWESSQWLNKSPSNTRMYYLICALLFSRLAYIIKVTLFSCKISSNCMQVNWWKSSSFLT